MRVDSGPHHGAFRGSDPPFLVWEGPQPNGLYCPPPFPAIENPGAQDRGFRSSMSSVLGFYIHAAVASRNALRHTRRPYHINDTTSYSGSGLGWLCGCFAGHKPRAAPTIKERSQEKVEKVRAGCCATMCNAHPATCSTNMRVALRKRWSHKARPERARGRRGVHLRQARACARGGAVALLVNCRMRLILSTKMLHEHIGGSRRRQPRAPGVPSAEMGPVLIHQTG